MCSSDLLTLLTHTTYDQYRAWSRGLVWLLGPATVAFALPIYQHRHLMARLPWTMVAATLTGIVVALGSTWLCVWAFDLPVVWWHTLMPRSVSTPFALPISVQLGGVGDLTVLSVLVTGLIGMVWGPGLLACLGWDDPVTCGMALGASAHGIGTARAYQLSTMHGMLSSLTMIFSGIGLSLIAPWLAHV